MPAYIGPVVAAVLVAQVQNQAGGVRLDEAAKRRVNLKESSARVHLGRISAPRRLKKCLTEVLTAYPVYGPFAAPPPGGNFIQADGNPTFETSFNQVINGLTVGTDYSLSFWQAAGQQQGFSGATTEQWKVFLGTGSFSVNCGVNPCTVSTTGDMTEHDTALMDTPSQGVHGWELVSMDFLASASSETLSFLAWGDNGNTTNLPPTVFLAGVNSPALPTPEPSTWAMMIMGFVGLGYMGRRRLLAKRAVATS